MTEWDTKVLGNLFTLREDAKFTCHAYFEHEARLNKKAAFWSTVFTICSAGAVGGAAGGIGVSLQDSLSRYVPKWFLPLGAALLGIGAYKASALKKEKETNAEKERQKGMEWRIFYDQMTTVRDNALQKYFKTEDEFNKVVSEFAKKKESFSKEATDEDSYKFVRTKLNDSWYDSERKAHARMGYPADRIQVPEPEPDKKK